jgi:1-acyl-sn-glycerol-3-phosphate acyltransferase
MSFIKNTPDFATAYGSRGLGALRLIGFFALIILLVPTHMLYKLARPKDAFFVPQHFHRLLMKLMGFRIRVRGVMSQATPTLFVSNHASYLDIPVLATVIPAAFVAKSEVAGWPLIGFLAKQQNTVFVERRSSRAGHQRDQLRARLAKGQSLIIFPEGTSTDGLRALPFKSSLFSIAEDVIEDMLTVQPVSITCTALHGLPMTRDWRSFYAWYGDMTLVGHLWDVFKLGCFTVDIVFHPTVTAQSFPDRKALAQYCHRQVAHGIEQCLKGRELTPPQEMLKLPVPA